MDLLFVSPSQEESPSFPLFIFNRVFSIQRSQVEEAEEDSEHCMIEIQQDPETGAYENLLVLIIFASFPCYF